MSDGELTPRLPAEVSRNLLVDVDTITVLHVDDEPDFLELTRAFLERDHDDVDVVTETSVDAALERLHGDTTVDCIVSDYQMPDRDGIDFLTSVRETHPSLPFVLFTGKGSEDVAEKAISAGVTEYLQKERGTDQYAVLANRIRNAVEKTRAERNVTELLRAIETAREGISLLDERGHFVYVNQSYADTFGYDPGDLLDEHWSRLYPSEAVEHVRTEVVPAVPGNGVLREQRTMVRADGGTFVADHALAYTPSGLLVCNVTPAGTANDGGSLHADALDHLDDLLFFFDEDGTLQYWNDTVERVTGYSSETLSSLTPADFVQDSARVRMEQYVQRTREDGEARIEVDLQLEDGETIPYEFISKRVTNDQGVVVGRVGLGRDISERKRYEREIQRQNERLEHFAEVLSHDLRNPLTVAKGHLDLYAETGAEEYYETTTHALARIESLITDVLTLAQSGERIDASEYDVVGLAAVAEEAWSLIRHRGGRLVVEDSIPLDADASRLQQILENLFRNALEHGDEDATIRVGLLGDADGFYVEDDGPGVPTGERDQVFVAGHSTKAEGTGFGLATVKQLVEAHGWTVTITESEAGGARFEFRGVEFADSR